MFTFCTFFVPDAAKKIPDLKVRTSLFLLNDVPLTNQK